MWHEWQQFKQGSKIITEYITKFKEYLICCNVEQDECVTLARFRMGLHDILREELIFQQNFNLQDAYKIVQNFANFRTYSKHLDPTSKSRVVPHTTSYLIAPKNPSFPKLTYLTKLLGQASNFSILTS